MMAVHARGATAMYSIRLRIVGAVIMTVGLSAAGAAGQASPEPAAGKSPLPATPESVAVGKQIYLRRCASCHAASGEGGPGNDLIPAAPSLVDDPVKQKTDSQVFNNIKNGIGPDFNMVSFKDTLKDDDIWNVVNFLRSIAKK
jgi:putative copper resistance protein D